MSPRIVTGAENDARPQGGHGALPDHSGRVGQFPQPLPARPEIEFPAAREQGREGAPVAVPLLPELDAAFYFIQALQGGLDPSIPR